MELQNQIYLLIAVFGCLIVLIFVLIVLLSIYIKNAVKLLNNQNEEERYPKDQFDRVEKCDDQHNSILGPSHQSDLGEIPRNGYKTNVPKARNDDEHQMANINNARAYRTEATSTKAVLDIRDNVDKNKRHTSRRHQDSIPDEQDYGASFDTEISNIFDISHEEDLEDGNSVENRPNLRYAAHRARPVNSVLTGQRTQAGNHRNRGEMEVERTSDNNRFNHNQNSSASKQTIGNRNVAGNGCRETSLSNSFYNASNEHEEKTFYNERGINY